MLLYELKVIRFGSNSLKNVFDVMLGHLFENVFKDVMTDDEFANWLIFKNIFEEVCPNITSKTFLKNLSQIELLSGILAKVNKPNKYILISHKHKLIP